MKVLPSLFMLVSLLMLNQSCQTTAKESQHESWMFIWSTVEIDGKEIILVTDVKKIDQQYIGDQVLVDRFKDYYEKRNILDISEPVIVSSDTKDEAEKDREFRIQDFAWDEDLSLAKDFMFNPPKK